jgi:hypothetical protein
MRIDLASDLRENARHYGVFHHMTKTRSVSFRPNRHFQERGWRVQVTTQTGDGGEPVWNESKFSQDETLTLREGESAFVALTLGAVKPRNPTKVTMREGRLVTESGDAIPSMYEQEHAGIRMQQSLFTGRERRSRSRHGRGREREET